MGSGGGSKMTSNTYSQPPAYVARALKSAMPRAQELYGMGGPKYFPGETLAPMSKASTDALDLIEARARAGSPVTREAQGLLQSTLRGDYLDANPWLDATYEKALGAVRSAVDSKYGLAYRTGSGAEANAFVSGAAGLATDIYGGNYQSERDRMMTALGLVPEISGLDYKDMQALADVGGVRDTRAQQEIDDAKARWDYEQQMPYNIYDWYLSALQGHAVGSNKATTSSGTTGGMSQAGRAAVSGVGGGLSGAAAGAAVGSAVPGVGTAIGAIVGGILGAGAGAGGVYI